MQNDITKTINGLKKMIVAELRDEYSRIFNEYPRSSNRLFLIKRIAWRIQVNQYGDLTSRIKQKMKDLADENDVRVKAPSGSFPEDKEILSSRNGKDYRLPPAGSMVTRNYKGENVRALILEDGFEYDGEYFKSLSAIARHITGSRWNGYKFFGLEN